MPPFPGAYGFIIYKVGDLCLFDAIDRADRDALWGIVVSNALDAGVGIDNIKSAAFTDRARGAFRLTSAAGNARIVNFHRHNSFS